MKTTSLWVVNFAMIATLLLAPGMTRMKAAQESSEEQLLPSIKSSLEARNKAVVVSLYFHLFNGHELSYADKAIAEGFIQHNPNIEDGRAAIVSVLQALFQQAPQAYWNIDHIVADGDLVWLQTDLITGPGDPGTELIDIYRVKDGKVVEHWDAIEPVSTSPKNSNTQF